MATNFARRSFLRTAVEAFIEARQRQASAYVNNVLQSLDDETLRAHGYNRAALKGRPDQADRF
jgi:hypothetical protein